MLHPLLERYQAAVFAKDVDAFLSLFADDLRVFDMWGEWIHEGKPAWKKMAADWFGSLGEEKVRVDCEDVKEFPGALTAILRFTALDAQGKELRSLQNRLTWVIANGKIVHEHTSSPIDHATLKAKLQR